MVAHAAVGNTMAIDTSHLARSGARFRCRRAIAAWQQPKDVELQGIPGRAIDWTFHVR